LDLSDVDLNLLKVFEALYIEQSVTLAAKRLGVAQSSLSSSLKRLRILFRDELFVRSANGMVPTKHADTIEPYISDCLGAVKAAIADTVGFSPETCARKFVIGGSDFTAFTILPSLIKFLMKNAPLVRLEMKPIPPNETADCIDSGQVDIVICAGKSYPKKLFQKKLFEEDMAVIISKDNPLVKSGEKLTLEKYSQLQHIYISSKGEGEKIIDRLLKVRGMRRETYLTVPNFLIVPYLVENSDLVATVSKRVAHQCAQDTKLNIHQFPAKIDKNSFHLLWGKASNCDPECQWLINCIANVMESHEKPQA